MKTMSSVLLVAMFPAVLVAQGSPGPEWKIMPGIAVIKYFPGDPIQRSYLQPWIYPPVPPSTVSYTYAGTALQFQARCFHEKLRPLALTFGGGVNWYYAPGEHQVYHTSQSGIGESMRQGQFMTFPLTAGVHAIVPFASPEALMFYGGLEASLHFVSGTVAISEQTKGGVSLVGGFAVKVFEFGLRYTTFSDMKNLGAHLGLRFTSFGI